MTNLDPKHLDALTLRLVKLAKDMDRHATDDWDEHEDVMAAADTSTALRAQIDRERAATIEAAARRIEPGANANDIPKAVLTAAQASIRALHTDATRAAMDAIRREGYEAGVMDAVAKAEECGQRVAATYIGMILCGVVREWPPSRPPEWGDDQAHQDRSLLVGDRYPIPRKDPEPMRSLFEESLADSIPPDPDTNADSRQQAGSKESGGAK